jgi:phosphatidylserine decarboxylase
VATPDTAAGFVPDENLAQALKSGRASLAHERCLACQRIGPLLQYLTEIRSGKWGMGGRKRRTSSLVPADSYESSLQHTHGRTWPFAEGGGSTILAVSIVQLVAVLFWLRFRNLAVSTVLFFTTSLWLTILYFFRDPNRQVIDEPGCVIAPGDGQVVEIVRVFEDRYLQSEVIRISIFLAITDVHVQRVPLSGRVSLVQHQPGKFLQAFRPQASDVNEAVAMVIEGEYGPILIKQIAGILARRCVNMMQPGDTVTAGQRYGLIKFGSRLDLFLPTDANLLIAVGDRVYGGLTPIARLQKLPE